MLAIPSHVGAQLNAIGVRVTESCVPEVLEAGGVRWEFRPGSTLFAVWQHGREGPDANNPFSQSWRRDYRDLFDLHPDNTFLVKVAYWLSR